MQRCVCLPVLSVCHKATKKGDSVFLVGCSGAWCCEDTSVLARGRVTWLHSKREEILQAFCRLFGKPNFIRHT